MAGDIEFWTSHLEACRREGTAASVYARQHGLTLASLYYWRRKLAPPNITGNGGVSAAGKFVALRVVDAHANAASGRCTLVLGSGLRLEMTSLPSAAWLLSLEQAHDGAH